jgi:hypothetical protein
MTQVVVVFHLRKGSEPEAEKLAAADPMGAEYSVSPGTQLIRVGGWSSISSRPAFISSGQRRRPCHCLIQTGSECVNLSEIGLRGEFVFVQQPAKAGTTSASRDRASDQKHTVPNPA